MDIRSIEPYNCSAFFTRIGLLLLLGGLLCAFPVRAQDEDLTVTDDWLEFTDASNALYHHISRQAQKHLEARKKKIQMVKTQAQWERQQREVSRILSDIVGPLPEQAPLNAEVVDRVEKDGYRIEHVVYESIPDFYVSASLFIPNGLQEEAPGIVYCSGHTANGYRSETYQHVILNLVRKGFVVLAFDPVSQGERLQYFDREAQESRVGGPTDEHSYAGAQAFIAGRSQARYMAWDGIRAIDYLVSRPEVDPQRIGVTGRSGGGTQTAYIAALDERVRAAAPENYITSFQRLLQSIAPQDGEQNFYHGIASGIDHADLLEVRAPKPTLMLTTTRDFFSIQGARETYREVKRAYRAFGAPGNIRMVEDDASHTSTRANREAMYAFFQRHLDQPGDSTDREVELLSPEELQVTETGQMSTSRATETIFSLNQRETASQIRRLEESRQALESHLPAVERAARRLSGYRRPEEVGDPVFTGRYRREGYVVEKYFVRGEGDYPIPYVLMRPNDGENHPAALYLHPEGKAAEAAPGGEIETLVRRGFVVLAPDLLNLGEMGPGDLTGDAHIENVSYNKWFASVLIGRSIVGIQAGDVNRLVQVLLERTDTASGGVTAVARGELTPVLLHAAAFEPAISRIALIDALSSYESIVEHRFYAPKYIHGAVAGALTAYDLPDLAAALAPREFLMANVMDGAGEPIDSSDVHEDLSIVERSYRNAGAGEHLSILTGAEERLKTERLRSWIEP